MTKEELFFQLTQVAIGMRERLSCTPSEREWGELYAMAKKQSLVGVCFAGVQKLSYDKDNENLSELLYLKWMGMAAKIQQRTEVITKQCIVLQQRFAAEGYRSVVLKGQDYARYYGNEKLCKLRQSGDIDLWVDGDRDEVIAWVRKEGVEIGYIDIKHSDMQFFSDTGVEVHFQPSWMYCPKTGKRLRRWFEKYKGFSEIEKFEGYIPFERHEGILVPSLDFSLVYAVVHIYKHFFSEGIGLRQVLDYYFLLLHANKAQKQEAMKVLKSLHMKRAVRGIMYLLVVCFGMEREQLLCEEDAMLGKFLLQEMMICGNFGHDDDRFKHLDKSLRWQRGFIGLKRNWKYLRYFPEEVLWSPIWKVWHYCWRKKKGYL